MRGCRGCRGRRDTMNYRCARGQGRLCAPFAATRDRGWAPIRPLSGSMSDYVSDYMSVNGSTLASPPASASLADAVSIVDRCLRLALAICV